jgi:hypothetical protein
MTFAMPLAKDTSSHAAVFDHSLTKENKAEPGNAICSSALARASVTTSSKIQFSEDGPGERAMNGHAAPLPGTSSRTGPESG